jgi:trehalose 6-phosphate phosphatase
VSRTATANDYYSSFFRRVATAAKRVLILDYDGTVAPFAADRYRAVPYPEVPGMLRRIMSSCGTRLVVVSGRSAHEIPPLLGLNPAPEVWGTHGIERILADGRCDEVHVSDEAFQILAQAEVKLDRKGLGERIEVKVAGVAVHWRGLRASEILKIRTTVFRILEPLAAHPDLILAEFEEGVEIRLRSANKGAALQKLMAEVDEDVPIAYLGDDATDEDAFHVLNGRGLSVLVGEKHRSTAAQISLRPPDELTHFLTDWIAACRGH